MTSRAHRRSHSRIDRQRKRHLRIQELEDRSVPALVAAYGFEAGSGTVLADSSGNNQTGTIAGAAWTTAGRFGNALTFDGVNDWVTVNDSNLLDLTTGMTLMAWVRPTAINDWETVLLKENGGGLAYSLYAADGNNRPPAGYVHNGADRSAIGASVLPLNTWTHLAATYNGSTLQVFVNGASVGSTAVSGAAAASANPLRIGGNAPWGEFFAGQIDEVRIYNNALTAQQITTDMNTPVGGGVGDSTPPTVTAASPAMGAINVAVGSNLTVTFSEAMSAASITASSFELRNSAGALIPASVSYNPATLTATLDPNANLAVSAQYFTSTVKGGASGVKDAAGNSLAADFAWSFSTGAPAFQETNAFSGLVNPTVIRFAPDGRVFVAEKSGIIKVFDNLADTTATVFADLRTNVYNAWDRGLLGMALDPNFAANPFVYVLYTHDAHTTLNAPVWGSPGVSGDPLPSPPGATGNGVVVDGRLSRLQVLGGNVAGPEQVLIEKQWIQQFPSHSTGTIAFGADGALYATAGDGASFNYVDYGQTSPQPAGGEPRNPTTMGDPANEGGALRSQDLLSPADATTLDGTIIRVDPATGAPMPGNPLFATGNDNNARRIIAHGLRNPFRFTFRPGTNELWVGDVGWNTWEEINRVVVPTDSLVENFGWPAYEGAARQSGYDAQNLPLLESLYAQEGTNPNAHIEPYYAYNHSAKVDPASTEPTGGSSIAGLAFAQGGNLPAAFNGALFFCDYSRDTIWVMYRGVNGLPDPNNIKAFVRPALNPVNLEIGPDGSLFYPNFDGGTIQRLRFVGPNLPPTAVINANPTSGAAPLLVQFNGSGSNDPEGGPLTFAWDLDGDGQFDDSTAVNPTFTYTTAGNFTAGLRVTDNLGAQGFANRVITVGAPPTAIIDSPLTGFTWKVGDVISFAGRGTDPDDGNLPASALSWSWILHHNTHTHPLQDFPGVAGGSFTAPDHEYPSHLELRLTVTDSSGMTDTESLLLQPQTVNLSFVTSPNGLQLTVNSTAATAPFSRTVIVGSTNTVAATSPQSLGGTSYVFSSWSDGGAQAHSIVAPAVNTTYTASYNVAPAPTGLVAAYGFDGVATDSSGNNLHGAVSGAVYTTGRYGQGLSFDGVNDWVTVNDANPLDLTSGMTLMAWVFPTSVNDWETILLKERGSGLSYALYGADGNGRPPAGYIFQGGDRAVVGPSMLPLNAWTHIATTYDGSTQRLVIGGVQAATRAQTGNITTSTNPLRIGGNAPWGEYFNGRIDEVRVYNRALSDGEITTAMNTPIGSPMHLFGEPASGPPAATVSANELQPLFDQAVAHWRQIWPDADLDRLSGVSVEILDLPGTQLGLAGHQTIWIDRDAAGHGWFIDSTPWDSSEFADGSLVSNRADMLTVIVHELGHVLGLDDDYTTDLYSGSVMGWALPLGVRRIGWSAAEPSQTLGGGTESMDASAAPNNLLSALVGMDFDDSASRRRSNRR